MDTQTIFMNVVRASRDLSLLNRDKIDAVLMAVADAVLQNSSVILDANKKDLLKMSPTDPRYDRLLLTEERLASIVSDVRKVASLSSPIGEVMSANIRPNGMIIEKVRVPFGVIGVIYEARPNVTLDVFSLCFKTNNAVILKGGSEAEHSNKAIVDAIKQALGLAEVNSDVLTLLPCDRKETIKLIQAHNYVDLIIPRGSAALIDFVRKNATVPVIETGAGVCHTYYDAYADLKKGVDIILNAKTRRVSVCNALDTLVIHKDRLSDLPALCSKLADKHVVIYADGESYEILQGKYPDELLNMADESHFGTEFLDYKISVKAVSGIDEAIDHITVKSSKHSESIITEDKQSAELFTRKIDAACVYVNVSTAFTDGGEFGFGSEIGISTQKLHARGPMGLAEITTYKYIISGEGQVR